MGVLVTTTASNQYIIAGQRGWNCAVYTSMHAVTHPSLDFHTSTFKSASLQLFENILSSLRLYLQFQSALGFLQVSQLGKKNYRYFALKSEDVLKLTEGTKLSGYQDLCRSRSTPLYPFPTSQPLERERERCWTISFDSVEDVHHEPGCLGRELACG